MTTTKPGLANPVEFAVEVVYARADVQSVVRLVMTAGMTVGQAIAASGLDSKHPELAKGSLTVGIFGKPCESTRVLHPGDRVEIYRPLRNDPRVMRRARAAAAPKSGVGAKSKPGVRR